MAAVVKADAYGLGAGPVADTLAAAGCGDFFVATAAEGVALRTKLAAANIYVLEGPLDETLAPLRLAQLIPVLNTPAQARAWADTGLSAALHIDTGMQRLGVSADQASQILSSGNIRLTLIMTHLARGDEPGHEFNRTQVAAFADAYRQLTARHGQRVPGVLSLSNSGGILGHLAEDIPQLCGDAKIALLDRAGIALYGGNPFADRANPMHPVIQLEARVLRVVDLEPNVAVGYGGTYVTKQPTRLATLAAGYADGVPRLLSNLGQVWLQGQLCPIVGRVTMDMIHVDVSGVPDVREGDWAEVIGAHVKIDDVGAQAQTISYEVLTGLGRRGQRIFSQSFLP